MGWKGNWRGAFWRRSDLLEAGLGAVGGVETAYARSGPALGTGSRRMHLETEGVRALDAVPRLAVALAYVAGGVRNVALAS